MDCCKFDSNFTCSPRYVICMNYYTVAGTSCTDIHLYQFVSITRNNLLLPGRTNSIFSVLPQWATLQWATVMEVMMTRADQKEVQVRVMV